MMGGWFALIGGFFLVNMLMIYFDPEATIVVNDVPTTSPQAKLRAIFLSSFFLLIGLATLLLPKRMMNRIIIAQESMLPSKEESFTQKLYRVLRDRPLKSYMVIVVIALLLFGIELIQNCGNEDRSISLYVLAIFIGFASYFIYFFFRFSL